MKTYKGRTPGQQREYNLQRKELARKKKEAQQNNLPLPENIEEVLLSVEAEEVQIPKLSLKDRLLSKFQVNDEDVKPVTKQDKEHTEKSSNLLSHVLPLTLAGLIAIYSRKLFPEEYQECAPQREEVAAMLTPLFSIMHRHVGIEGKASQDAIDFGAFLLSGLTMGTRMLMTSESIRRSRDASNSGTNASSNGQATDAGNVRPFTRSNAADKQRSSEHDGYNGNGDGTASPYADEASEASIVAELFKRDTEGRRQMGLAPRRLRTAD